MRRSINRKVAWGTCALLLSAMLAMGTTYFVSTAAIQSVQESHELGQTTLAFTAAMEIDTLAGGNNVLQHVLTGDPSFRLAYQQHSERYRQYVRRLSDLSRSRLWQDAGPVMAGLFRGFDKLNLDILARHQPGQRTEAEDAKVAQMLDLQQQITSLIATRVKPNLAAEVNAAESRAAANMIWVLCLAGGVSLLLALLTVFAGRYVRLAIVAPIEQLAASADTVAAGDLTHRVKLNADEEYMALARNFNRMVTRLQSTTVSKSLHEEQATQLRVLLDGVRDYAIFSIDQKGLVTRWNAACTRILGY